MIALAFLVDLVGCPASVRAGNDVGVVVAGDDRLSPVVSAQIKVWLARHDHVVVAPPMPSDAIATIIDCIALDRPDCARDVVERRANAGTIVYARVDAKPGARHFIVIYWFEQRRPWRSERAPCERCTAVPLMSITDTILTRLTSAIATAPDRAGPGPPPRLDARDRDESSQSRALPLVALGAMGAGAALVIGGGVLIAIDQNDDPRAPPRVQATLPVGVGLSIVGVAAAGFGAYVWSRRPKARSSPVAAVTADTMFVGWLGRF